MNLKKFTKGKNFPFVFLFFFLSLFLLLLFISKGTINFSFKDVLLTIFGRQDNKMFENIILNIRIPRVLGSFLVGSILAVSGNILQLIIQNPLAEPYLLGISSGASFGAVFYTALVKIFGFSIFFGMQTFSFFFAVLSTLLVFILAKEGKKFPIMSLILSGVIISFLFNSITTLFTVMYWKNLIHVNIWLLGSTSGLSWNDVYMFFGILIILMTLITLLSKQLNVLSMGDEMAVFSGINPEKIKLLLILICVLAVSIAVSITGIIGFVGLIIPHIIRMLKGPKSLTSSVLCVLGGGIFLTFADFISRTVFSPAELPIGVVTSLIGAPMFIYVMKRRGNKL